MKRRLLSAPADRSSSPPKFHLNRAVMCRVTGGLANQMICYKFGRYVAETYDRTLLLDTTWYESRSASNRNLQLTEFNIKYDLLVESSDFTSWINDVHSVTTLTGELFKDFESSDVKQRVKAGLKDAGEIVVGDIFTALTLREEADAFAEQSDILRELTIDKSLAFTPKDHETQEDIDACRNSVAVHVRRGDFATHDGNILLTDRYFQSSIEQLRTDLEGPQFFIFSDDIPWCRENLNGDDVSFVDFNDERHGFKDLVLAASCRHFILSNLSTFSHQILQLSEKHPERRVIRSKMDDMERNQRTQV